MGEYYVYKKTYTPHNFIKSDNEKTKIKTENNYQIRKDFGNNHPQFVLLHRL